MKQNKVFASLLSNWIPKILSLAIAVFIVIAVRFLNINDRIVTLPLEVALPEALAPASLVPDTVDVAITGPDSIIYLVNPDEIKASISSVKELYPGKKVSVIFQPHLYSRTRDFADDFARSLSLLDELILLDIYPAREKPIPGVTSRIIFDKVTIPDKILCDKRELLDVIARGRYEVVLMVGAGDIDRLVEPVREILCKQIQS